jgi:hypothetical protein
MPDFKTDRPNRAVCVGCLEMPAWMEVAMDECMGGEKGLRLLWRLEPLHLSPFWLPETVTDGVDAPPTASMCQSEVLMTPHEGGTRDDGKHDWFGYREACFPGAWC